MYYFWRKSINGQQDHEVGEQCIYVDPILGWSIWVFGVQLHERYHYGNDIYFIMCDSEDYAVSTKMIKPSMQRAVFYEAAEGTYKQNWILNDYEKAWLVKHATERWEEIIDAQLKLFKRDIPENFYNHNVPIPDYTKIVSVFETDYIRPEYKDKWPYAHELHEYTTDGTWILRDGPVKIDVPINNPPIGVRYLLWRKNDKHARISLFEPKYIYRKGDDLLTDEEKVELIEVLKSELPDSDFWDIGSNYSVWDYIFKVYYALDGIYPSNRYRKKFLLKNHPMPDYTKLSKDTMIYIPNDVYRRLFQL